MARITRQENRYCNSTNFLSIGKVAVDNEKICIVFSVMVVMITISISSSGLAEEVQGIYTVVVKSKYKANGMIILRQTLNEKMKE